MNKSIAVLLTVHNRKEKTLHCLENLHSQLPIDGYEVDVYMTDDGCTDGTPDAVKEQFPRVYIIQGDGTLFWNRGMWTAWKAAANAKDYDYYLWLNDDTYLKEDAIARLLSSSESHDNKAIIIGSSCSSKDETRITYGGIKTKMGHISDVSEEHICDTFEGNIVLIPKQVYNIVGKNDPIFHHAVGDNDYGYRATESGVEIYVGRGVFGVCDQHDKLAKWEDANEPFKVRWGNYFSPYSSTYKEYFMFRRRHFGLLSACTKLVTSFLHMLMPTAYNKFIRK